MKIHIGIKLDKVDMGWRTFRGSREVMQAMRKFFEEICPDEIIDIQEKEVIDNDRIRNI